MSAKPSFPRHLPDSYKTKLGKSQQMVEDLRQALHELEESRSELTMIRRLMKPLSGVMHATTLACMNQLDLSDENLPYPQRDLEDATETEVFFGRVYNLLQVAESATYSVSTLESALSDLSALATEFASSKLGDIPDMYIPESEDHAVGMLQEEPVDRKVRWADEDEENRDSEKPWKLKTVIEEPMDVPASGPSTHSSRPVEQTSDELHQGDEY